MSTVENGHSKCVSIGPHTVGNSLPFTLFAGLNVLEHSVDSAIEVAQQLATTCGELGIPWVFKASFDKANRSSADSYRGPGLKRGLDMLSEIKRQCAVPVMTDIHEPDQAAPTAEVADVLQIPAFLCRQTDLLSAAASTGAAINIKKAQFLAPEDMRHALDKCERAGNNRLMLCERGSCFGYHRLIVDMLGFDQLKAMGYPVLFDVSHSLQLPGAAGDRAGGRRNQTLALARSAMAQGLAGLFLELHPDPEQALCDGPCALPLAALALVLRDLLALDQLIKAAPAPTIQ